MLCMSVSWRKPLSALYSIMVGKHVILTATQWTERSGPQLSTNWNSHEQCDACHNAKLSETPVMWVVR